MTDIPSQERSQERPTGRRAPMDLGAELAVIGAMMLSADARRNVAGILAPEDFYKPANGHLFAAILDLHGTGVEHGPVDARTVADVLRRQGLLEAVGGPQAIVDAISSTPSTTNIGRYAGIVAEMAALRKVIGVASDYIEAAYGLPGDVGDFLDRFRTAAGGVDLPSVELPDLTTLDRFMDEQVDRPDWVIPPFVQRGDRLIVIAEEGVGKGVLLRQLVAATGQGVNPFTFDRMPPGRSMLVDLENPATIIRKTMRRMVDTARAAVGGDYDPGRTTIWHEPAGIDLRSRADFARFDTALAIAAPDLVCVGPLYKLFRKQRGESDEDAALDVTGRLDDLRTRHGFALVIEHHAPKASGGHRELAPFGSSVWLRWPEFGPALYRHHQAAKGDRSRLEWGHWRGPRDERPWPTEMSWGPTWPWEFRFDQAIVGLGADQMEAF